MGGARVGSPRFLLSGAMVGVGSSTALGELAGGVGKAGVGRKVARVLPAGVGWLVEGLGALGDTVLGNSAGSTGWVIGAVTAGFSTRGAKTGSFAAGVAVSGSVDGAADVEFLRRADGVYGFNGSAGNVVGVAVSSGATTLAAGGDNCGALDSEGSSDADGVDGGGFTRRLVGRPSGVRRCTAGNSSLAALSIVGPNASVVGLSGGSTTGSGATTGGGETRFANGCADLVVLSAG